MRRLLPLLLLPALCADAFATWSIVVIKRSTREVAVGCATCITSLDLVPYTPVVRPGLGVANLQSSGDVGGTRKPIVWAGLEAGDSAEEILAAVRQEPFFQNLQLGLVTFDGGLTYSGEGCGAAICGVAGDDGDLIYAIQGNVMTGPEVCAAAEHALLTTDGDLAAKLMAAMLGAYSMGGDGRCSCARPDPFACGAPPPSFTKSAHTGFVIVARVGDEEGSCATSGGCANGQYYLLRKSVGGDNDPDPILDLEQKLVVWRDKQRGKPDHVLSSVAPDRQQLVADGASAATISVTLRDIDGAQLTHGGAVLTLVPRHGGAPPALPGPVTDHGDGTYSFELVATTDPGRGEWDVVVDFGGAKTRQLWPPLALETVALTDLHCGFYDYPAGTGLDVPFELNRGAAEAGRAYHLLGTLAGTTPGVTLAGVHVPLNRDDFFVSTWLNPGAPGFPGSQGVLDPNGHAAAQLVLPAAVSAALVGERFHFCALLAGAPGEVTSLVTFPVLP